MTAGQFLHWTALGLYAAAASVALLRTSLKRQAIRRLFGSDGTPDARARFDYIDHTHTVRCLNDLEIALIAIATVLAVAELFNR